MSSLRHCAYCADVICDPLGPRVCHSCWRRATTRYQCDDCGRDVAWDDYPHCPACRGVAVAREESRARARGEGPAACQMLRDQITLLAGDIPVVVHDGPCGSGWAVYLPGETSGSIADHELIASGPSEGEALECALAVVREWAERHE